MMNMELRPFKEEETMMIDHFISTIKMTESRNIFIFIKDNITRLEVEVGSVELKDPRKVSHTTAIMS